MGSQDAKRLDKRDKQMASRSKRLEGIRHTNGGAGGAASYGELDPRLLARLIWAVTSQGGAVMLALTSDGGAYAITFYDNGDRERVYIPFNVDVGGELEGLIALWAE